MRRHSRVWIDPHVLIATDECWIVKDIRNRRWPVEVGKAKTIEGALRVVFEDRIRSCGIRTLDELRVVVRAAAKPSLWLDAVPGPSEASGSELTSILNRKLPYGYYDEEEEEFEDEEVEPAEEIPSGIL